MSAVFHFADSFQVRSITEAPCTKYDVTPSQRIGVTKKKTWLARARSLHVVKATIRQGRGINLRAAVRLLVLRDNGQNTHALNAVVLVNIFGVASRNCPGNERAKETRKAHRKLLCWNKASEQAKTRMKRTNIFSKCTHSPGTHFSWTERTNTKAPRTQLKTKTRMYVLTMLCWKGLNCLFNWTNNWFLRKNQDSPIHTRFFVGKFYGVT